MSTDMGNVMYSATVQSDQDHLRQTAVMIWRLIDRCCKIWCSNEYHNIILTQSWQLESTKSLWRHQNPFRFWNYKHNGVRTGVLSLISTVSGMSEIWCWWRTSVFVAFTSRMLAHYIHTATSLKHDAGNFCTCNNGQSHSPPTAHPFFSRLKNNDTIIVNEWSF